MPAGWTGSGHHVLLLRNRRRPDQSSCPVLFLLHGHQGGGTEFPLHHSVLSDHQLFADGSDRKSASFPDPGSGDHGIWRTDGRLLWTNY